MVVSNTRSEMVEALGRGLAVIEAFDDTHADMTLTEVAQRTGLSPATARRILRTLEHLGYAGSRDKRFFLRPRVLGLGSAFYRAAHIGEALMPELQRLIKLFGDATSVGILSGRDVFYLAHLSDQKAFRPIAGPGVSYPAHATSMGQVLLAGLTSTQIEQFLEIGPLAKMTNETITDPEKLRMILAEVNRNGYATVKDQLAYGVTSIAVPIFLPAGVVAAINSSGYSGHVTPEMLVENRLEELRLSARHIGDVLLRNPQLKNAMTSG